MKPQSVLLSTFGAIVRIVVVIVAIYFIYVGSRFCYNYGYRIFTEPAVNAASDGRNVQVIISDQMKAKDIAELFEKKGLVRDWKLFFLQYYASEYREDLKPGTYELSTAMTADEMLLAMTAGSDIEEEEEPSDTFLSEEDAYGFAEEDEDYSEEAGE